MWYNNSVSYNNLKRRYSDIKNYKQGNTGNTHSTNYYSIFEYNWLWYCDAFGGIAMERMGRYLHGRIISKVEMERAEEIISNFLNANNVKIQIPVDTFALATELGFDVRGATVRDDLDGMVLVNEAWPVIQNFKSNRVIIYRNQASMDDKKFIVAHELSHYIKAKSDRPDAQLMFASRDHGNCGYSEDSDEQFIDYMGAALLIPKADFIARFGIPQTNDDYNLINKTALRYNVRWELAERRVKEIYILCKAS